MTHPATGRRGVLLGLGAGVGALAACHSGSGGDPAAPTVPTGAPTAAPPVDGGRVLWAADLAGARDSAAAGYGDVRTQRARAAVLPDRPPVPVVRHPMLGPALALRLGPGDVLAEAQPGGAADLRVGDDVYVRFDVVLGRVEAGGRDPLVLSRVLPSTEQGPPPFAVAVRDGVLWALAGGPAHDVRLARISPGLAYSVVYRLLVGSTAADSRVEVWLDTEQVLADHRPGGALAADGAALWAGATLGRVLPGSAVTAYQSAHRIGTSYLAVIA